MNEASFYIIVFILAVFSASCSQILLKKAAGIPRKNKQAEYLNWQVIVAYGIFGLSAVVTLYVLRHIPLSLAPILESATYIFVPVLSWVFLGEKLKGIQLAGMSLIFTGIVIFNL